VLALLLVAASVGLDNFGAAAALGVSGAGSHGRLKVAAVFGAFEAAMPLVGLFLGRTVARGLGDHADLVAGLVLCLAGLFVLVQDIAARGSKDVAVLRPAPGLGRLIVLAAALSIDNLAVGFALGASRVNVVVAALVIGVVSCGLTLAGLELGSRLGARLGPWGERAGGVLLVLVGVAVASGVI
jgi:manganese efflux pump family protein